MTRLWATAAFVLIGACAPVGARVAPPASAVADQSGLTGYLGAALQEQLGLATPLPPEPGSTSEAADHAASAATFASYSPGAPRWTLAQYQAEISPPLALAHFDCPLGTRLSEEPPPAMTRLFTRALMDVSAAARPAKARIFRARPFVDNPDLETCIRVDDSYRTNSSAPSSHATAGIVFGRIMADIAPDQSEALMLRGRAIGESRLVCRLHYAADVEAGQALGEAVYQAIAASPDYQADIALARTELAEAQTLGRTNPACAAERLALDVD